MNTKIVQVVSVLMLGTILIGATSQLGFASALVPIKASGQATTQSAGPTDPQELEAFLDDLMSAEMAENQIPGAMVAVVEDGRVLLAKGYGYGDMADQIPVDPERTLFRVGSVSKLFTWTAVMQLLEQDKVSLDTDVNEYLDFTIPATFPEPITLRHLLSHTAGFEQKGTNLWRLQAGQMVLLGDWMKDNLPARVFPAGEIAVYSNYGTALAGYIVERVSGLSFDEYVERNIFVPLGMTRSTFRQPLPSNLAADMAAGYGYADYIEGSFEFQLPYPVGAMSGTATDMARFMIAHLQNGELDGQRILREETAILMHSQLYTPDPRLESMAYGFFESTVNGQRILSHGGDTTLFHSGLYLLPNQNVGLFISTNGMRGGEVVETVQKAFLDHYYPAAQLPAPQSAAGFAERIAPYLGEYTEARSNFTTYEKIYEVLKSINASLDSDGILVVSRPGRVWRFAEVEPGLLQDLDDPANRWVYQTGPGGRLFLISSHPSDPLFRTPWYGTGILHLLLFVGGTLLFLAALVVWPIGYFAGRRKQSLGSSLPTPRLAWLARWVAAFFGLLWLVVLLGITSIFMDIVPVLGYPRIIFEAVPRLNVLLALSYGLAGLTLAILVFAALAWVHSYWRLGGRIFYTLLALFALLLTWSLAYWNLFL